MATPLPSIETRTAEVSFPVTGMTCASCVNRIERAINKVPGVERAAVNLATERATVSYDPTATNVAAIAAAVEKAGYGVPEAPPDPIPLASAPYAPTTANGADDTAPPSGPSEAILPIELR